MKKVIKSLCYLSLAMSLLFVTSCSDDDDEKTLGNISGVIQQGEIPIEGIKITLTPGDITETSTQNGEYKFANIEAGDYTLTIEEADYEKVEKEITLTADKHIVVNIKLISTTMTVNFDELLTTAESEYIGTIDPDAGPYDYTESTFTDPTGTVTFNHYTTSGGAYFGAGFTYTNRSAASEKEAGYTNCSSITGKGVNGNTYMTCNDMGEFAPAKITFKTPSHLKGCYLTNSSYTYYTMKNGNSGSTPFDDTNYFNLIITGKRNNTQTASITFKLATGKDILNSWEWADLTSLGEVDEINFNFESNKKNDWGITVPTYFCMDALTIKL